MLQLVFHSFVSKTRTGFRRWCRPGWVATTPSSFPKCVWGAKLAALPSGGQFALHVRVQVALHIQIGNVMLIQVVQPCDDFFNTCGVGIRNIARSCTGQRPSHSAHHCWNRRRFPPVPLLGEVRQAALFHVFDSREDPLGNYIKNIAGIVVLEFTPAPGLSNGRLGKNLLHLLAGHMLKFFRLQLFSSRERINIR